MNKEAFKILKEINSLYTANQRLFKDIESEQSRATKISNLSHERAAELEQNISLLKDSSMELTKVENQISELQSKLDQNMSNINKVFSENEINSLQKQMDTFQAEIMELESKGLELIETIESLEKEIDNAKSFIKGSEETLAEIVQEIELNNKEPQSKIEINEKRIELLFEQVPSNIKETYLKLISKNLKYGPVCQVESDACSICRMSLPKLEIDQIEKNLQFKQCSSCSRIFIPISSLY